MGDKMLRLAVSIVRDALPETTTARLAFEDILSNMCLGCQDLGFTLRRGAENGAGSTEEG
jgi:hypothetical protein